MNEINDRDIKAFAEQIGRKIAKLERLKQAAEAVLDAETTEKPKIAARKPRRKAAATLIDPANGTATSSRKQEVAAFLMAHGPSGRTEIQRGTGIPKGTLGFVLNDESMFLSVNGKWDVLDIHRPLTAQAQTAG